jgi:regulator of protease activity HflC (stomatin/prohibitin superfamily)
VFNPKKVAQFLTKLLAVLLPILGAVLVLSFVAEVYRRKIITVDQIISWRFWLGIALAVAPSIVALLAVYLLAVRFVQRLYGTTALAEAQGFVHHRLFGLWSFGPWLRVAGGILEGDRKHVLMRVGGPGHLVVYNDSAVLLEKGGRFTRVEGKGFVPLKPFEKALPAIDLRPQRWVYAVTAISKEGIPIVCEAEVNYQIDNEGLVPTEEVPFPISEDKIFQAATCTWIREANRPETTRIMDWGGRVIISETEGNLRTILARYPLDRLIGLMSPESENPREEIRQELEQRLKAAVPRLGARILGVELADIRVQDEVTQQWIDVWKAEWERWAIERRALGKAKQARQIEDAKTRAQVMLLASITEAFQPLVEQQQAVTSKLVLARLFMVLSRAPSDPLTRVNLPKEAIGTLQLLKDLIV